MPFLLLSLGLLAVSVWAVVDELYVRRPWKAIRAEHDRRARARGEGGVEIALEQRVLPELGRIDRCETCHAAIDVPGADDPSLEEPYRRHPRFETLIGEHPPRRFGCTVCHGGQGMQTKGVAGRAFDHGLDDPYWEAPLRRGALVESSCASCHAQLSDEDAPTYALGRALFLDLGCAGCHESALVDAAEAVRGPPLGGLGRKMSGVFLARWIATPWAVRPRTRMPDAWPGEPEDGGRRWAEAEAIAAYLVGLDGPALPPAPQGGDPGRGRVLYRNRACGGCHEPLEEEGAPLGPELLGLPDKTRAAWLAAWLRSPRALWPGARMPDPELSEAEIADLVAYLLGEPPTPPERELTVTPEKVERGRALVETLGCHGCHDVPGVPEGTLAGPELVGFGRRTPDLLGWGDVEPPQGEDPLPAWTRRKIAEPHAFAEAGTELVMPRHRLDAAQVEALTVFSLAHREGSGVPAERRAPVDPEERILARGEVILARSGCRLCHEIGYREDAVRDADGEVLWTERIPIGGDLRFLDDPPPAAAPSLSEAGLQFRYRWLYDYLADPPVLRPWLSMRMPHFDLDARDRADLVAFFAARQGLPHPYRPAEAPHLDPADEAEAILLFSRMQCLKCHELGSTARADERAPDLRLSAERLHPEFVRRFILDPQSLQPGTRMPDFFPLEDDDRPESWMSPYPELLGGDVHRQVEALTHLTLELGRDPALLARLRAAAAAEETR